MKPDDIRQLADIMKSAGLSVLDYSEGEASVHLERAARPAVSAAAPAETPPQDAPPAKETANDLFTVASPMIGVFYNAPAPDVKPFISLGERVHAGDVVCIIEAMKMMNEITAEVGGIVAEVCVGNKQIVEYGHPLFRIRRDAQ